MAEQDSTGSQEPPRRRVWPGYFNPTISLGQLVALGLAAALGVVAVLLVQNAGDGDTLEFSTVGLLGFVFSIAIGGASIVLAIAAIGLGKASEQAMVLRSDDSIKLQNEVFRMTTLALQKIASSTGVTEKRIEDIISGRVGDISERVAEEVAAERRGRSRRSLEEEVKSLEQKLRRSILNEIGARSDAPILVSEEERTAENVGEQDSKFRDAVLLALSNTPELKTEKIGVGYYADTGDEAVDGIFTYNGLRIGFSVNVLSYMDKHVLHSSYPVFLRGLALSIEAGVFQYAFLVYDDDISKVSWVGSALEEVTTIVRPEIASRIQVLTGSPEDLPTKVKAALESATALGVASDGSDRQSSN